MRNINSWRTRTLFFAVVAAAAAAAEATVHVVKEGIPRLPALFAAAQSKDKVQPWNNVKTSVRPGCL